MRQDDIDDDLFPLGAPDRRTTERPRAGRVDLVVACVSFGLSVPLTAVGWFGVLLSKFAFDACSAGGCQYAVGSAMYVGFPIAAVVSTVLFGIAAVRRRRRGRRAWGLGLGAVLTVVALFVSATTIVLLAATPD